MARRVLAPDGAVVQAEVAQPNGSVRRYSAKDGGVYTVADSDAARLVASGFTEPSATGTFARSAGFRCTTCKFGSFFTTCSRCGGTCEKE